MPIAEVSHSKICFSRLNQRRITPAAKKKYIVRRRARGAGRGAREAGAGCPAEIAFQSLGLWTCKEVITFRGDSGGSGDTACVRVLFICDIPFSRFINAKRSGSPRRPGPVCRPAREAYTGAGG
ncbi:hypothetical protein EVAR_2455_1 [Eumeta japonica]|uniref:Uncharacterized protein n=1 Tax=Eumeta variegata TaxID=151549 RepID=A0A4C1SP91_EUMVA|nr:hypothetical protein EVAR_2455_1 [Eumeta japonica]